MNGINRPSAFVARASSAQDHGDPAAAVTLFRQCLDVEPDNPGIHYNLGNALLHDQRPVEAAEAFAACLRVAPDFGPAYVNLAETFRRLLLLPQAREMAENGVRLMPDRPQALMCLANILHDAAAYPEAEALYRSVLAVLPDHPGVWTSLGNTLRAMGRITEALAEHDQAATLAPDDADIRYNRATCRLAAGDFALGWPEYQQRWNRSQNRSRDLGPSWQGQQITDRTILLHAEQGLGDTLQFVRYVPYVVALGARVVLEVQAPLAELLRHSMPGLLIIPCGAELPAFDTHCPLLNLPAVFGTTLQNVPAEIPYLSVGQERIVAWGARLGPRTSRRVGLVWAGGAHTDDAGMALIDRRRSLCPDNVAPLVDLDGMQWVNLQKGRPTAMRTLDLMPEINDFADTAALIAHLDLVISVDTSVAHLAGALGCPVWLLSRYDGCWRWLVGRADSPWYPTMRIYRQDHPLDWSGTIQRVRQDLFAWAAAPTASIA